MKALVVAAEESAVGDLVESVFREEYRVDRVGGLAALRDGYCRHRYEFAVADVRVLRDRRAGGMPDPCASAIAYVREKAPAAEFIALAPPDLVTDAVLAVKGGARSYLTYPLVPEEIRCAAEGLQAAVRRDAEIQYLRKESWNGDLFAETSSRSPRMQAVLRQARSVATADSTVLLTGETGTGKGVLARFVHGESRRRDGPFVTVHCGAIPESLIESELFGHERGAFTGAIRRKPGRFETAHSGTIFLDEIATISPALQIKLLKVVQERSFCRVGGDKEIQVDVRVIAACNDDLKRMAGEGRFRPDLYYRLSVFPIEIPPLRDRLEDIPTFVAFFLRRLQAQHRKPVRGVAPTVVEAFQRYAWPGNIRELENVMERAYVLEESDLLRAESFPLEVMGGEPGALRGLLNPSRTLAEARQAWVDLAEGQYLRNLLERHAGRINRASEAAGIGPRQLRKLLARYQIRKEDYRGPGSKP